MSTPKLTQEQIALIRAVDLAKGQTSLARQLNELINDSTKTVKQAHIWNWINRDKRTPAEFAPAIEHIVKGAVTRQELRPDVLWSVPDDFKS